jgi:Na+-transporting methylmalonyl-CoA/oxaloacetate decarboxylase beta subunit
MPPRHPPTRSLAVVLRASAATARPLRILVAGVTAAPDSAHVTIDVNGDGDTVTVPKLASYTNPVAGDVVYCIAAGTLVIALGTIK